LARFADESLKLAFINDNHYHLNEGRELTSRCFRSVRLLCSDQYSMHRTFSFTSTIIRSVMLELQSAAQKDKLAHLHAATCLSMTRFINGHHCPQLAHTILHQLNQLLAHPELEPASNTRAMYLQLLEHWQKIAAQLLEQRQPCKTVIVYH
jgi:hypothetical protein